MIPDKKRFCFSRVLSAFTKIDPFPVKNAKKKSLFLARHTPRLLSPVLGTRTFPFSFLRFLSSRALVLDYLFFYQPSVFSSRAQNSEISKTPCQAGKDML